MNIEEMRERLMSRCIEYSNKDKCDKCPIKGLNFANCLFKTYLPNQIETAYNLVFGDEKEKINHLKKVVTNYDRIRNMSVEEMASYFCIGGLPICPLHAPHCKDNKCPECFKKWLESEVEE